MEVFSQLGEKIEKAWRDVDFDEERLPAIAAEHLRGEDLPSKVTAWEVLEWSLAQTQIPRQKNPNSNFGDPPITLYAASKFYIDVYFWFEGTTSIHQHGFCGAFQVLHGSSIHSWYEFEPREKINNFMQIGDMNLRTCELLEKGAVQEIWPGRSYIHSLFHLDSPSATICVRTDKSPVEMPQFSYHKPSLAIDPFYEEETIKKKLQVMSAMLRAKRPDADEHIGKLLAESDFQSTFLILSSLKSFLYGNQIDELFNLSAPKERFKAFFEIARKRHGEKVDIFTDVFAHHDRLGEIMRQRNLVTDPEHRLFFALLLNMDSKEPIFSLIKQRYPKSDPREKVLDWVFDLSQTRVVGSHQQNALGIYPFEDVDLMIFEHLLDGKNKTQTKQIIESEYPAEKFKSITGELKGRIAKIKDAVIFGPLFVH
ncbi:MAG: hypothetical protein ACRD6X_12880 [Pyrinomonadaceae bacterium]